jgi:hypothetical protein
MPMRYFAIVLLSAGMCVSARANNHILYECVDQEGNKQFTNIVPPGKHGCKVLNVGPVNSVPAGASASSTAKSQSKATASPANFPRVDPQTQQQRDGQRRRILEQELSQEQQLLDQAKKALAEQESIRLGGERNYQRVLDRLEPYQQKVKVHEDNVANLRRELSNMR